MLLEERMSSHFQVLRGLCGVFDVRSEIAAAFAASIRQVDERKRKYGENIYDIPLPDFWELFQELR